MATTVVPYHSISMFCTEDRIDDTRQCFLLSPVDLFHRQEICLKCLRGTKRSLCFASLSPGGSSVSLIFTLLLATHKSRDFRLNGLALAQHYGIPTGYLDLSDNFDVSAFFATCRETDLGWAPVDDGVGVMYRIDMQDVKDRLDWLVPLGPQSLPRPEEQKGWVCELPIVHSFDGWPVVKVILFEHDPSVGEHFLKIFDGGQALFPPDPLAETAKEIRSCGEIPKELIENALEDLHRDPLGPNFWISFL